jgi:hypothetical protein
MASDMLAIVDDSGGNVEGQNGPTMAAHAFCDIATNRSVALTGRRASDWTPQ